MLFHLSTVNHSLYYGFAAGVYCCIAVIIVFVLVFGLRARRNIKKERITSLPERFSPLDVKRIFIGKTYPRRLTRALITYWAECGFIKVVQVSRSKVRIIKIKDMPPHGSDNAVFFDRGTYVRERDLFSVMTNKFAGRTINLYAPLFSKSEVKSSSDYAVREDEGVYSSKHYTLKIVTIALCIVSALIAQISAGLNGGTFLGLVGVAMACIALSVFMFVRDMPIFFKLVWCGIWFAGSTAMMNVGHLSAFDPLGITVTSIVLLYIGPLFLIRFVDYREKNNLADYSDLVNFRRFLLFAPAEEVRSLNYYEILPILYALRIKTWVKKKFGELPPPSWFECETKSKGGLL